MLALPLAVVAQAPADDLPRTPAEYLARMDTDGDGLISLREYLDHGLRAFDAMDRDGDGILAGAELPFAEAAPVSRVQRERALARMFARMDRDGDGMLTLQELTAPPR
ncbi:hypothetical protein [Coralloluteibacterium thermophilus]|uniref:EF-hand domain-containing protein n=1 Tax=Coralloluteibacterium thermophilum TaxID=2707049 RepID=A0ABV9NK25_9GAMM